MIYLQHPLSDEGRHLGKVAVSLDVLAEALHLPKGSRIQEVGMSERLGEIELIVEHPDLYLVRPGSVVSPVQPNLREEYVTVTKTICEGWVK